MSIGLPPLGGLDRPPATRPAPRPEPAPRGAGGFDAVFEGVAGSPPPEVSREVAAAADRAAQLRAEGVELRFEYDDDANRVRVEVRDLDGNVLREIPLTAALDVAAGARL